MAARFQRERFSRQSVMRGGGDQGLLGADPPVGLRADRGARVLEFIDHGGGGTLQAYQLSLGGIGAIAFIVEFGLGLFGRGHELLATALHVLELLAHLVAELRDLGRPARQGSLGRVGPGVGDCQGVGEVSREGRVGDRLRARVGGRDPQQFDLRRPGRQRRVELGQRALKLRVVVAQRFGVGARDLGLGLGDIESRLRGLKVVGVLGIGSRRPCSRRDAISSWSETTRSRAAALSARAAATVPSSAAVADARSLSRSSSACCMTEICACACASCSSRAVTSWRLACARACAISAAVRIRSISAVRSASCASRPPARGSRSLRTRGSGPRACPPDVAAARARASAWSRSATASSRSATRGVALGPGLVTLGSQEGHVGLGRRAALTLVLQTALQLGDRQPS